MTRVSTKSLTGPMQACLAFSHAQGGSIHRHPGGYWGAVAFKIYESFGTSTVEALVTRGELEYTEWQDGRNGRFPIRATVKSSPSTSTPSQT